VHTQTLLTHTLASGAVCTLRHTNPGDTVPKIELFIDHRIPEGIVTTLTTSLTHTDGTPSASGADAQGLVERLDSRWVDIVATPVDNIARETVAGMSASERANLVHIQDLKRIVALCTEMIP
jgi:hypothetical protein